MTEKYKPQNEYELRNGIKQVKLNEQARKSIERYQKKYGLTKSESVIDMFERCEK